MKPLNKYIEEKLVVFHPQVDEKLIVNKNYMRNDTIVHDMFKKFITEYIDNCPKNDEYSKTDYMMVFRGTLQVSFNNIVTDCGIKVSAIDKEYFKEIEEKMLNHFKTKTIYRFLHGTNLTRELYERISKPLNDIYSDLDKNDIQFEQIFNVKTNDGDCVVEYYDGNDIIVLHMGTEKFAYTFVILL